MYDSIMVPIDRSNQSEAAVEHARGLADEHDATVHLLHAVALPKSASVGTVPNEVVEDVQAGAEDLLEETADEFDDVPVETTLTTGVAVNAIEEYVGEYGIDLVVMGTHGRSGVKRVLLGSTTERTLRSVDVPVLAVESA